MTLPSVSILIVNYKTPALTLACIDSIYKYPPQGLYEVIVVDNDSRDDSVEKITAEYPKVILLPSEENLGFSGGNNLAMEQAKHEILLLLNSDTEVHENALVNLQKFFIRQESAAAVGGKNYSSDGSVQYSIRYFPRLSNALSESLFLHRLFNGALFGECEKRLHLYNIEHEVEWVSGSYLAIRREWYEKVGGLDAGFFMYSEDTDWCYRIKQHGGSVWYCPESTITHYGGGSSKGSKRLPVQLILSRDRYARLHFTVIQAGLYRLLISLRLGLRFLLLMLLSIFKHGNYEFAKQRLSAIKQLYNSPLELAPLSKKK
jgi:GT2 family glycosyltransferase